MYHTYKAYNYLHTLSDTKQSLTFHRCHIQVKLHSLTHCFWFIFAQRLSSFTWSLIITFGDSCHLYSYGPCTASQFSTSNVKTLKEKSSAFFLSDKYLIILISLGAIELAQHIWSQFAGRGMAGLRYFQFTLTIIQSITSRSDNHLMSQSRNFKIWHDCPHWNIACC